MAKEFTFDIDKEFGDHIVEEKGNMATIVRKISWGNSPHKLDIRKWRYTEEGEMCGKGVSLSDEGADELTETLSRLGYGDTRKIIDSIKDREDFKEALDKSLNNINDEEEESTDYYDPKELLSLSA